MNYAQRKDIEKHAAEFQAARLGMIVLLSIGLALCGIYVKYAHW